MDTDKLRLPETMNTKRHRDIFDIARRVHNYMEEIKETLRSSGELDRKTSLYQAHLLTTASQIQISFISVIHLGALGHLVDAGSVMRTQYEHLFHASYVATDPDNLSKQWAEFEPLYRLKNAMRLMTSPDRGKYKEEIKKVVAALGRDHLDSFNAFTRNAKQLSQPIQNRKYFANWTKMDKISDIAQAAKVPEFYRSVYEWRCDAVHPSIVHVMSNLRRQSSEVHEFGPKLESTHNQIAGLIGSAAVPILLMIELLLNFYGIASDNEHNKISDEIRKLLLRGG